jgi:hypothetical protein
MRGCHSCCYNIRENHREKWDIHLMGKLYKVGQSKKKQAIFSVRTYEKLNNAKAVLNFAYFMNLDFF